MYIKYLIAFLTKFRWMYANVLKYYIVIVFFAYSV